MQLEAKKYLYDIAEAAEQIAAFTAGKTFADYESDAMLRSAVERQFEIVGEALGELARLDEAIAARITDYRRIIAFRNILDSLSVRPAAVGADAHRLGTSTSPAFSPRSHSQSAQDGCSGKIEPSVQEAVVEGGRLLLAAGQEQELPAVAGVGLPSGSAYYGLLVPEGRRQPWNRHVPQASRASQQGEPPVNSSSPR